MVKNISYQLIELQKHISSDFARKRRALSELCHWKGTEFRLFVLYIGPLVLKNMLNPNLYAHFITLHTAIRILSSSK